MTTNAEKIFEMTKNFAADSYGGLTGEITDNSVYEYLYQQAIRIRESMSANNRLLNGWLNPLLKNSEKLTHEQADDLFEQAQALFQPAHSYDIELAATIYEALVNYSRTVGDTVFLIKSLYWNALTLHYMDRLLFYDEILSKYTEAAEYHNMYREIDDFETRKYINRALGNLYVTKGAIKDITGPFPILEAMDEAREFWTNPEMHAFDPDMPWESFIYSIHQNTCSTVLTFLREKGNNYHELANRVYESAVYLIEYSAKHFKGTQAAHTESILEYYLTCAKYHTGRITAREAGERFLSVVNAVRDDDYSLDAVNKMTHTGLAMTFYLSLDPEYPKEELQRITNEHCHRVVSYCAKIPHGAGQFSVDAMIGAFVYSISTNVDKDLFIETILKLTTYRNMTTYVHSLMVSWLGELISAHLCDNNPEYFIGIADTHTAEDVREKREEIVNYARVGGLCHDVGKIMYLNIIASHGRKLSNREFAIVHRHPDKGYELLQNSGYKGVAEIAHGHHKWYDGSKGYPTDYDHRESEFRPIIDIISICNVIDNSTDILSRSNAVVLSRREIVKQIQAMGGTKYAPDVASALNDDTLAERIDYILNEKRREAYSTAYKHLYAMK